MKINFDVVSINPDTRAYMHQTKVLKPAKTLTVAVDVPDDYVIDNGNGEIEITLDGYVAMCKKIEDAFTAKPITGGKPTTNKEPVFDDLDL